MRRTRPVFTRHRPDRKASLDERWKKPRGLHNKLKDRKRGCNAWVSGGYRTPVEVRGMHISGLSIVHVANAKQLDGVNKETHGIVISAVGAKRQLELLAAAKDAGIRVLNHNSEERTKELTTRFKAAAADRKTARDAAAAKAATQSKKAKPTKPAADTRTDAEKRDAEDKIKEEVLTKGQ